MMRIPRLALIVVLLQTAFAVAEPIPITFDLAKPGYVTLVVDDLQGRRVCNLIGETQMPAGKQTVYWDGYRTPERQNPASLERGDLVEQRVEPGQYRVRGLVHDGVTVKYELTFNYSGKSTPWKNVAGTGAWLAEHSPPLGIAFIPAKAGSPYGDQPQVLISAQLAETGHPFAWVATKDLQTLQTAHYWGWEGANAVCVDTGDRARKDVYAYVLRGNNRSIAIRGFKRNADIAANETAGHHKQDGRVDIVEHPIGRSQTNEPRDIGLSIAAWNGLVVASVPLDEQLVLVDAIRRRELSTVALAGCKGLAFDARGRLLATSGTKVVRFDVKRSDRNDSIDAELGAPQVVIASGLEAPHALAVSQNGDILVTDWGKSHQVKVFSETGVAKRPIGEPGGIQVGRYSDRRMHRPNAITLDDQGRLWVAENDWAPKRVSVWNLQTGQLVHAFYGPSQYGGGGTIDPQDPTRLFYSSYDAIMEFELDFAKGTSKLVAVPVRAFETNWSKFPGMSPTHPGAMPERVVRYQGRTYLVGFWQGLLRGNTPSVTMLFDETTHTARPVAWVGSDRWWWDIKASAPVQEWIKKTFPGGSDRAFMTWSDRNLDGKFDVSEFSGFPLPDTLSVTVPRDGRLQTKLIYGLRNFVVREDLSLEGEWGLTVPSPGILPSGVPVYDLSKVASTIADRNDLAGGEAGRVVISSGDGWQLATGSYRNVRAGLLGYKDGVLNWIMPSYDFPSRPGVMVHEVGVRGPAFTPKGGDAGKVWLSNGEKGALFFFTSDGLFIQTIGGDMRTTPMIRTQTATRGLDVTRLSFEDEHFHPSITQVPDGKVYLVAGKEHSSVFRIDGLETVKRLDLGSVDVRAESLAGLPETRVIETRKQERRSLTVKLNAPALVDGSIDEWADSDFASIRGAGRAALRVSGDRLFAAFDGVPVDLLTNSGKDWKSLFATGGAIDIFIAASAEQGEPGSNLNRRTTLKPGDQRLLVTRLNGEPRAVLYQAVDPAGAKDKVVFRSPIGEVNFDSVTDVTDQLRLVQKGASIELSIPLQRLGLSVRSGDARLGDLGIVRGDGRESVQRSCWNNMNTDLVSDIPSEARLEPARWGWFRFE